MPFYPPNPRRRQQQMMYRPGFGPSNPARGQQQSYESNQGRHETPYFNPYEGAEQPFYPYQEEQAFFNPFQGRGEEAYFDPYQNLEEQPYFNHYEGEPPFFNPFQGGGQPFPHQGRGGQQLFNQAQGRPQPGAFNPNQGSPQQPPFNGNQQPRPGFFTRLPDNINKIYGHVGTIRNGVDMVRQLGAFLNAFRGPR